jgi:LPXTG-motif cell wall-anchored protein
MAGISVGVLPASASTLNGTATLENGTTPLTSGPYASTQQFTVALPSGASCTGDTAHDSTHEYSYLVPQGTNLSTVTYTNLPSVGLGLVSNSGTYFASGGANTAASANTSPPYPGLIIGIPLNFEFAPLITDHYLTSLTGSGGLLYTGTEPSASGVWEAGIACVNSTGTVTDNWNTEVTFSYSATDPNNFVWTSTPGPDSSDNGPWLPEIAWAGILPAAGLAILGGTLWFSRRRKSRKEDIALGSVAT